MVTIEEGSNCQRYSSLFRCMKSVRVLYHPRAVQDLPIHLLHIARHLTSLCRVRYVSFSTTGKRVLPINFKTNTL